MMVGLPRKSVPGLPVVELTPFAKEVVCLSDGKKQDFHLGCILDNGIKRELNKVCLDAKSLTQHTFVTGSTGCGKSNTVYYLINQICKHQEETKFLIIEPAKGEYKDVFGDVNVYGTNPLISNLLKINPFKFPKGVHVLEHIDKLVEIFNVCWPMYAAMPAILKDAILESYQNCGWDLTLSRNIYSNDLFPTFVDLQSELINVISNSAYSDEIKSNYQGSLVTRIKSLTNGINGQIFSSNELGDEKLFDENVIVDLSRVGSQETKSLIMGLLIMRLSEYRSNSNIEHNSPLRHVTVLEEAHNILKKCSQEQSSEGSNVAGKSVEMISNAIAEMRTFGEGFIIVDQSPGAVDISAIRNTNTKIIMRLPEQSDRQAIGKSAAMRDNQIDEIAKLPTGAAVVYQNDWEEPVLCKINKFEEEPIRYKFINTEEDATTFNYFRLEVLKFLLSGKINKEVNFDVDFILENIKDSNLTTSVRMVLYRSIEEFKDGKTLKIWEDRNFDFLSRIIVDILPIQDRVAEAAYNEQSFQELDNTLGCIINETIGSIHNEFDSEIKRCLLREFSLGDESREIIYNAWNNHLK